MLKSLVRVASMFPSIWRDSCPRGAALLLKAVIDTKVFEYITTDDRKVTCSKSVISCKFRAKWSVKLCGLDSIARTWHDPQTVRWAWRSHPSKHEKPTRSIRWMEFRSHDPFICFALTQWRSLWLPILEELKQRSAHKNLLAIIDPLMSFISRIW